MLAFLLISIVFLAGLQAQELIGVVTIYRHGDRTPISFYPNDPLANQSLWPVGFGQLTNLGKHQHLELGRWFRARYSDFLPLRYSEKDIRVRSTDVDRTLMSAEANLAGLYPPNGTQVWDQNIIWQPIPVHTKPELEDALLAGKKNCPKYNKLYKELFNTPFFQNITLSLKDLYEYLTNETGSNIQTLQNLEYIYNTLSIEQMANLTLPDWTKSVFPEQLAPYAYLSFATQCYTKELARLKTGPLLNNIVEFFNNRTTIPEETVKMLMFSGHDTTIANVLRSLDLFELHSPGYASTILFELRKNNSINYVNIFYKNSSEPQKLTLKNCEFNCEFNQFKTILAPLLVDKDQHELECKDYHWVWPLNLISNILFAVLLAWLLLSCTMIVAAKIRKTKHESSYIQLPNEEYT